MNRARRRVDSRHLSIESLESRRLLTTAMPDSFSFFEDSPTVLLDVMANDVIFGNLASIVRVSTVDYGIVEIQDSDKVAFTPARNAFGDTSFTYTIRDQFGFESRVLHLYPFSESTTHQLLIKSPISTRPTMKFLVR